MKITIGIAGSGIVVEGGGDDGAAGRVGERGHPGEEVALLLEHVGFTLPLPHEQLALLFACHANPVTSRVYGDTVYLVLRDLEGMDRVQSVEVVQAEHAIRLTNHKNHFAQLCARCTASG